MDPTTAASALNTPWWQSGGTPDPNAQQMAQALAGSPMDPITGLTPQESMHSGRVLNAIGAAVKQVAGDKLQSMYDMATYPFHHAYPPSFSDQDDPRTQGAIHNASDIAMRAMARSPVRGATGVGPGELKIPNAPEWATPSVEPIGIHAYHGSPHDFDKFDISKIGTGEGAQAYGHGLYFAGNEGVARSYRDQLRPKADVIVTTPYREGSLLNSPRTHERFAADIIEKADGDIGKARETAQDYMTKHPDDETVKKAHSLIHDPNASFRVVRDSPGHMYEVNIKADPEHFLGWDKPIGEHSPQVQEKIKDARLAHGSHQTVKDFIGGLSDEMDPSEASKYLHEAGIPGIKYLDQGSRSSGEGSNNYVTFNDQLVELLRKYGIAGMLGTGAAAGAVGMSHGGEQQQ